MGIVVMLPGVRNPRFAEGTTEVSVEPAVPGFSRRDRQEFGQWSRGGRRVTVCNDELGTFATFYECGRAWASWGMTRHSRGIQLWNCVSLADVGYFPTVAAALAAIADPAPAKLAANVVPFARRGRVPVRARLRG